MVINVYFKESEMKWCYSLCSVGWAQGTRTMVDGFYFYFYFIYLLFLVFREIRCCGKQLEGLGPCFCFSELLLQNWNDAVCPSNLIPTCQHNKYSRVIINGFIFLPILLSTLLSIFMYIYLLVLWIFQEN